MPILAGVRWERNKNRLIFFAPEDTAVLCVRGVYLTSQEQTENVYPEIIRGQNLNIVNLLVNFQK